MLAVVVVITIILFLRERHVKIDRDGRSKLDKTDKLLTSETAAPVPTYYSYEKKKTWKS